MRIYTVHELAGRPLDADGIVFVKEGFCWPAFFFGVLWALAQRLWLVVLGSFALLLAINGVLQYFGLGPGEAFVCSTAFQLLLGFEANDLRRWTLARKGYTTIGIASGRTLEEAEQHFFTHWSGPKPGAHPVTSHRAAIWPRRTAEQDDAVLGLFPKAGG